MGGGCSAALRRVERSRTLEEGALAIDPSLRRGEVFRDPEARATRAPARAPPRRGEAASRPVAAFGRARLEGCASNELAARAADAAIVEHGRRNTTLHPGRAASARRTSRTRSERLGDRAAGRCASRASARRRHGRAHRRAAGRVRKTVACAGTGPSRALIVDDVQFAAGKERTQEEVFTSSSTARRRQAVVASVTAPEGARGAGGAAPLAFEGGLVVELQRRTSAARAASTRF